MKFAWLLAVFALGIWLMPALGQELSNQNPQLEKVLWDVDQQWLCSGPYQKPFKDCVAFRTHYWPDQFFEVVQTGDLLDKPQMVATQTGQIPSNPPPGEAPYPDAFRLRAVYGDFAMATDITSFKTLDSHGRLVFTSDAKVLRLFVKQDGEWRPAAAGLVPFVPPANHALGDYMNTAREKTGMAGTKSPNGALERQLAEIDRRWMDSSDMNKRVAYVARLFTSRWFEILGWDPTGNITKLTTVTLLARLAGNRKAGSVVADQFQLHAVYGDVALASDRRTRTWTNAKGEAAKTQYRTLLVFVKKNGEWRSAGGALVPIMEGQ